MHRLLLITMILALGACSDDGGDGSAGGDDPAVTPAANDAGPTSVDSDDPRTALFLGFRAPKEPTWIWHPPDGRMRAANYIVPGRGGDDAAHIVVFHFPEGDGGAIDTNIERWRLQFRGPDETPVEPKLEKTEVAGMPVTIVELEGEWMKPGTGWFTAGQRFICAAVEAPEGNIFIRFAGDEGTVTRNREAFLEMVRGIRPEGS